MAIMSENGSILTRPSGGILATDCGGAGPSPTCQDCAQKCVGGPLTLTDANLILGRIQSDFFPAVFGENQDRPLDFQAAESKFAELQAELHEPPVRLRSRCSVRVPACST